MRVTPIRRPLSNERIVGVEPPLNPTVDARWQRRLNLYTGRALSDAALTTEQSGRAGRLATRGQLVSPGVVNGLIVGLESPPGRKLNIQPIVPIKKDPNALRTRFFFHISSGAGIMPNGEDIVLSRNLRVAVGDVPVYTTIDLLTKTRQPQQSGPTQPIPVPADVAFGERTVEANPNVSSVLNPRRLGPSLIELAKAGVALPRASILLLQPIMLKRVGEFDDEDPCEQDPQNYAFEDWQLVDGCQLILYTWPTELTDLLPFPNPQDSASWRNRLAYSIFEAEMRNADPRVLLPWEEIGLPIGLVGFDGENLPLFVDRYAVVRDGGKPKRRSMLVPDISDVKEGQESESFEKINRYTSLVPRGGNPFVWQARLKQFTEQLAEALRDNTGVDKVSNQFRFLPPAGLLPRNAMTLSVGQLQSTFFPPRFTLDAVPVPLEQLDVVINQSAPLRFFDTNNLDRLRVLVPVPQNYYEPDLLKEEKIDPEFDKNIATSLRKRNKWLRRRMDLYELARMLNKEIYGPEAQLPDLQWMGLDEGSVNLNEIDPLDVKDDPDDIELSKPEDTYAMSGNPLRSAEGRDLKTRINQGVDFPKRVLIGDFKGVVIEEAIVGLQNFIDYLDQKVRQADDIIDFGFVRVQTDIYRYRQLMLGVTDAVRLATSPALASIAKGETALATKEEIINFVRKAKTAPASTVRTESVAPSESRKRDASLSSGRMLESLAAPRTDGSVMMAADMHTPNLESNLESASDLSGFSQVEAVFDDGAEAVARGAVASRPMTLTGRTVTSTTPKVVVGRAVLPPPPAVAIRPRTDIFLPPLPMVVLPPPARNNITQQTAIIGRPLDFRTVTVAERIKKPPAPEAKDFTVSSKYEILREIEELSKAIILDDLVLPGFYRYTKQGETLQLAIEKRDLFDKTGKPVKVDMPIQESLQLRDIIARRVSAQVLSGLHDVDPPDGDESSFFASAVRASDTTIAILRIIEGRIQAYRNIIADCQQVLGKLLEKSAAVMNRLNVIEGHLAELRHDLAVARALKADEELRVNNINKRRAQVLNNHVSFLAFRRERTTELRNTNVKVRELDPAMVESPIPACLARDVQAPPELNATMDLLRDAPVKWFKNVHPLVDRFDRLEYLHRVVLNAKARANIPPPEIEPVFRMNASFGSLGQAIGKVIQSQQVVVSQMRVQVAQLDLSGFTSQSWQLARDQAREVISLGDLIDGSHGRGDVSQQAAREVSNITHIASCFYAALSVVLPVIRLNWAERLSQFDGAVNLTNLGSLPRWGEIPYLDRREMQTYADWLFSRIDRTQPEAFSLINDVIRICILLASHAPVNQLISASIAERTEVSEGGRVTLAVDPSSVRVGMHVVMYRAGQVAARAIVEDLGSGRTAARVTKVYSPSKTTSLEQSDHVQIAEAGAFNRNPLALVKTTARVKK